MEDRRRFLKTVAASRNLLRSDSVYTSPLREAFLLRVLENERAIKYWDTQAQIAGLMALVGTGDLKAVIELYRNAAFPWLKAEAEQGKIEPGFSHTGDIKDATEKAIEEHIKKKTNEVPTEEELKLATEREAALKRYMELELNSNLIART